MSIKRGDVFNARFPHASGNRGKKRPVLVVQADSYNQRLRHAIVVQLTTNLVDQSDPACLLTEAHTPEGQAAGLQRDNLVSGYLLSRMGEDRLTDQIGHLPGNIMQQVDACLRIAMGL